MSLRDVVWAASAEVAAIGMDAPHRATARFGPIVCADMGVPHYWGVSCRSGLTRPSDADATAALAWLREHGAEHGWHATVPASRADEEPWAGLIPIDHVPVFATTSERARAIDVGRPSELTLDDQPSHADVIAGYGGWMTDSTLAELLVTPEDLERADRRFIVGRVDGRVVGCAFVWFAANSGYLSGIGVVPELRGRGYGRTLTAAAAQRASHGPDGAPTQAVWMYATSEGAALYARMGFAQVDTEVSLTDR